MERAASAIDAGSAPAICTATMTATVAIRPSRAAPARCSRSIAAAAARQELRRDPCLLPRRPHELAIERGEQDLVAIHSLLHRLTLEEQANLFRRCAGTPLLIDAKVANAVTERAGRYEGILMHERPAELAEKGEAPDTSLGRTQADSFMLTEESLFRAVDQCVAGNRLGDIAGRRVAIVLDRQVISSPQVDPSVACEQGIAGGQTVITGDFTDLEYADIDWIIPHNVSMRSWEILSGLAQLPRARLWTDNIARHGQTLAGDNFINYRDAVDGGCIEPGQKVVLFSYGFGAHWTGIAVEA